jgi:hypothetical protein
MGSENLEVEKVQVNFLFWMSVWGKGTYCRGRDKQRDVAKGGTHTSGSWWNSTDASGSGTHFPSSTSTILVTTRLGPRGGIA